MTEQLLIRADASTQIGTGHIMRGLALAQVWQDHGGDVTFLSTDSLPAKLHERLGNEGMMVVLRQGKSGDPNDAQSVIDLAANLGTSLVVVDGYVFGAEYQRALKNAGLRVLFLDDNGHAEHYYADWVLNQNIHADESLYVGREADTQLLLGTRFALLRREFWKWRGWKRTIPDLAHNLLVTLGGTDPNNVTLDVLRAAALIPDAYAFQIKAVVGGSNPHLSTLTSFARDSRLSIEILSNVSNMPELMAWADVAISAGGSTVWELCLMGVPTLALILADNQEALVNTLTARGVLHSTHTENLPAVLIHLITDYNGRQQMSASARDLVDGYGVNRVLMFLRGERLWLREATLEDCELIWRWANDPAVRQVSFSSEPIPWETHQEWYRKTIENEHLLVFIAIDQNERLIGQLRYLIEQDVATVSISLDHDARGMGYGTALLNLGSDRVLSTTSVVVQHALIKPANVASQHAFERASFRQIAEDVIRGQPALRYERRRAQ